MLTLLRRLVRPFAVAAVIAGAALSCDRLESTWKAATGSDSSASSSATTAPAAGQSSVTGDPAADAARADLDAKLVTLHTTSKALKQKSETTTASLSQLSTRLSEVRQSLKAMGVRSASDVTDTRRRSTWTRLVDLNSLRERTRKLKAETDERAFEIDNLIARLEDKRIAADAELTEQDRIQIERAESHARERLGDGGGDTGATSDEAAPFQLPDTTDDKLLVDDEPPATRPVGSSPVLGVAAGGGVGAPAAGAGMGVGTTGVTQTAVTAAAPATGAVSWVPVVDFKALWGRLQEAEDQNKAFIERDRAGKEEATARLRRLAELQRDRDRSPRGSDRAQQANAKYQRAREEYDRWQREARQTVRDQQKTTFLELYGKVVQAELAVATRQGVETRRGQDLPPLPADSPSLTLEQLASVVAARQSREILKRSDAPVLLEPIAAYLNDEYRASASRRPRSGNVR